MNTATAPVILGAILIASIAQSQTTKPADNSSVWPMFRRAEIVTLEGKEIPEPYRRNKIIDSQDRSIEGEWLVIDRTTLKVKFRRKADGKEFEIPFNSLAESDRRYAELETGITWDPGNDTQKFPKPTFDSSDPPYDENGRWRSNSMFNSAVQNLKTAFTSEEIFDNLRVRAITTSFIYDYDNEWKGNYYRGTPRGKNFDAEHTRNLTEIIPMLGKELKTESLSLKSNIDKLNLKPFDESAPNTPPGRENDQREYGPPRDGLTQAYHFVAQYIGISNGKAKVPYLDYLKETTPLGFAATIDTPMWYSYDNGGQPVEKVHHAKVWRPHTVLHQAGHSLSIHDFDVFLLQKIVRHFLRTNKPVVVPLLREPYDYCPPDAKEGFAIIIGFTQKDGNTTYESIILYGPSYRGSRVPLPFKLSYKPALEPKYINWHAVDFIE